MALNSAVWPSLPLAEWQDTHDTLHMWLQIVGKSRLALAPRENHWWHAPLYVGARGLTTGPIPYRSRAFEVEFDFIDHRLGVKTSDGAIRHIALRPQAVADFYREYMEAPETGIAVHVWPVPVEVEGPIPFLEDRRHALYDAEHAQHFFRMLLHANRILAWFKGRFYGKSSPAHFFGGAFDLALTRFGGRRAPEPKDLEWWVLREAMSHEEISFGFWPGSGTVPEPAFYAYVRPEPSGFAATTSVRAPGAYSSRELADFILPYAAVRAAASPDEAVLDFYQSVYDAGADLARWDRAALDRPPAEWP
jgi:hypothetical protein